jgi:peptide methionine sulfoxide reductase msrA/msrB
VGRMRYSVGFVIALTALALVAVVSGCASLGTTTTAGRGADATATPKAMGGKGMKTIYFAGGCFWGVEKYMSLVHGVTATEVGYANGTIKSPRYEDVSTGRTGYAETVRVDYDPKVAPLPFLLDLLYKAIDPTTLNQQGNDIGTQYRSGIYYVDPADRPVIEASLAKLQKSYDTTIAIETRPLATYTPAEEYHQDYLEKNPSGYCHIRIDQFDEAAKAKPTAAQFEAAAAK